MTDPITDAARVLARHTLAVVRLDAWVCAQCGGALAMSPWGTSTEGTLADLSRRAMAVHQAQMLAEAGLLAAPDLLQVGPRLGASACDDDGISVCPKMAYSNKQLQRDLSTSEEKRKRQVQTISELQEVRERLTAQVERIRIQAEAYKAASATHPLVGQIIADIAGDFLAAIEWTPSASQNGPQEAREPVEDRMRALAADMGDTPLTATILRQFADEVAQVRAAGDRAIQSLVSRLPEGT